MSVFVALCWAALGFGIGGAIYKHEQDAYENGYVSYHDRIDMFVIWILMGCLQIIAKNGLARRGHDAVNVEGEHNAE